MHAHTHTKSHGELRKGLSVFVRFLSFLPLHFSRMPLHFSVYPEPYTETRWKVPIIFSPTLLFPLYPLLCMSGVLTKACCSDGGQEGEAAEVQLRWSDEVRLR